MSDLYEFTVEWSSTSAQSVIVTGDFDKWSQSLHMSRSAANDLFTATIKVPYGCPTRYKFIVDGEWTVKPDRPTEYSSEGYLNNVYYVPLKPSANGKVENGNGTAGQPLGITDWKDTIVASAGTSSALSYVASGFGETLRSVVGMDPYNSNQIAIPTPISPSSSIGLPSPAANASSAADDATTTNSESAGPTSVAPLVPIKIVPVYAKENCTIDPTKVTSDEESAGTFVGVRPTSKDDVKEEEGRKGDAGEEAPASPPGIPIIINSSSEEPADLVAVEAPKKEMGVVEAAAPAEDKAESASAPQSAPVATSEPAGGEKASVQAPEETPKKVEEPPVLAPAPEPAPASADKPATNGHAHDPSSASTKVASFRPTTPTGAPAPAASATASPSSTIRKSKVFPQLGKSSPSKASTNGGSTDDFGVNNGKGTVGKKKRTSSIFGSLKKLFHHEHDEKNKEKRKSIH